jgi:hypothetical protein
MTSGVEVAGQRRRSVAAPRRFRWAAASLRTVPNGQANRCVFGDISYRLPDRLDRGRDLAPGPGLELTAMVRWLC